LKFQCAIKILYSPMDNENPLTRAALQRVALLL
jgi:hypothetical protein